VLLLLFIIPTKELLFSGALHLKVQSLDLGLQTAKKNEQE
jgi:hypothetical protein